MPTFSQKLGIPSKTDNAPGAHRAKVTIRHNVLEAIGAERARVFDAFAGEGHMYRDVWSGAASYVGCDERYFPDERPAFVADNRRVLRSLDLGGFNVFDLDAYGSPWEQVYIIARRRLLQPGETIGLVLTEGQGMKMKLGGASKALALLAGIRTQMPGMGRAQDLAINRAIGRTAQLMGAKVADRWQAIGSLGSRMYYIGLVLRGD